MSCYCRLDDIHVLNNVINPYINSYIEKSLKKDEGLFVDATKVHKYLNIISTLRKNYPDQYINADLPQAKIDVKYLKNQSATLFSLAAVTGIATALLLPFVGASLLTLITVVATAALVAIASNRVRKMKTILNKIAVLHFKSCLHVCNVIANLYAIEKDKKIALEDSNIERKISAERLPTIHEDPAEIDLTRKAEKEKGEKSAAVVSEPNSTDKLSIQINGIPVNDGPTKEAEAELAPVVKRHSKERSEFDKWFYKNLIHDSEKNIWVLKPAARVYVAMGVEEASRNMYAGLSKQDFYSLCLKQIILAVRQN